MRRSDGTESHTSEIRFARFDDTTFYILDSTRNLAFDVANHLEGGELEQIRLANKDAHMGSMFAVITIGCL